MHHPHARVVDVGAIKRISRKTITTYLETTGGVDPIPETGDLKHYSQKVFDDNCGNLPDKLGSKG